MFDKATRMQLRFEVPAGYQPSGQLSVEDVWQLPVISDSEKRLTLDVLFADLSRKLKASEGIVSLVMPPKPAGEKDQLRIDIVKHVAGVKLAEQNAAQEAKAKADRKQSLLAALAEREAGDLKAKSSEELRAMIAAL